MPQRIQLKRTRYTGLPPDTVPVDSTTKWGNPFVPGSADNPLKLMVTDRRHAFVLYRSVAFLNLKLVQAARTELAGKNLGCTCAHDDPYEDQCHGAVLLQLANSSAYPKI